MQASRRPASPLLGLGKLVWRLIGERTVRPDGVVVHAPGFDLLLRVGKADKPVFVQALVANFPLKLSRQAFSIGLPGRMKQRVSLCA